jgi:hypothetical protein
MQDKPDTQSGAEGDRQDEYIYPASSSDAPPDAVIRSEGELAGQTRLRRPAADRQDDQAAIDRESGSD